MPAEFIHRFVPGRLPATVLVLHGTGGDEDDLLPIARALAPGAALLSPRGNVSEQGAARFFPRKAPGVFDDAEIAARAAELAEWIRVSAKRHSLDPARIYALGYSNGANIAAAVMLLHPGAIAGGVLFRPMPVIEPATPPDLEGVEILISAGEHDQAIPPDSAERLAGLLSKAGARVDLAIQNADHELTPGDFHLGKQWFARRLQ